MTTTFRQSLLVVAMITAAFIPSDRRAVRAADEDTGVNAMPDLAGRWRMVTRQKSDETIDFRRSTEPAADFEFDVPVAKSRRSYKLKWIDASKRFETTTNFSLSLKELGDPPLPGRVLFVVTVDSARELRMRIELDETAKTALEQRSREPKPDELTLDAVNALNEEFAQSRWKRVAGSEGLVVQGTGQTALPPATATSSETNGQPGGNGSNPFNHLPVEKAPRTIESPDVILTETNDGVSAFSKSLGTWDKVIVPAPKNGTTRIQHSVVGTQFAAVVIGDQMMGFSSKAGRWGKMTIPPEFLGKVLPIVGLNSLTAQMGDNIYALSPVTGQWMSSDGTPAKAGQTVSFVDFGIVSAAVTEKSTREKLMESIAEYEKLTDALAKQIRELMAKPSANEKERRQLLDVRRRLNGELSKIFDMKAQLEKIRVKELQTRLSQLEQQISQRQSQRDQIIDRRARELIQDDSTKWPANDSNAGSSDRTTFKPPRRSSKSDSSRTRNTTQVSFRFTDKSPADTATIEYDGQTFELPFRFNFERGEKDTRGYRLKLIVAASGIERPIDLYICSATPNSAAFLAHNSVAFDISMNDITSTRLDTAKAIYLPAAKFPESEVQDEQSVRVVNGSSSGSVFAEAERLGTPLAALILYAPAVESAPSNPVSTNDSMIDTPAVVMSTSPSYKQWATDFETVEHELATAQIELNYNKKLFESKVISAGEVSIHQGKFDTAQRKLDILKTALKAELQDLELQLSSDKIELEAASSARDKLASSPHAPSQLEAANRRTEQAKLTLQRRTLQYDLLTDLAKKLKLNSADSPQPQTSGAEIENRIHSRWKMRLAGLTRDETNALSKTKYHRGLRVTQVEPDGPAAKNGIEVDDVLVGLDKWETPTLDNVGWIINLSVSDKTSDTIKFFIIRAGETRFGTLPLDIDKTPVLPGGN